MRWPTMAMLLVLAATPAGAEQFVLLARGQPNARISASALRDLFLGRTRTWPGGRPVELAVPASDTPEIGWLADTVFGLSARELRTQLRQRVFAGEMPEPRTLSSSQDCIEFVRQSRGGLCVASDSLAGARPANVGALTVAE
ncbi:MAG: hypothetical protein ACJ79H_02935 [Myxococcales bacterium]